MDTDLTATKDLTQGNSDANSNGDVGPSFIETLPEDLRASEALKDFDSAEKLARAHLETLGKMKPPESPDAYELNFPKEFPVDQEFVKQAKAWAHQAGLSKIQFEAFAKPYIEAQLKALTDLNAQDKQARDAIMKEWGDKHDSNLEVARKAVMQFCSKEEMAWFDTTGMGSNPVLVKMFHRIGQAMSEDKLSIGGQSSGGAQQMERTSGGTPQLDFPSMRNKQ
jgi:hypothetical protein